MKATILPLTLTLILTACGGPPSSTSGPELVAKDTLDKWTWLPSSTKHETEVRQIPDLAKIEFSIPQDEPLEIKPGSKVKMDTFGNSTPKDKQSYAVAGGALVSKVGSVERKAKWGDWDFVYSDAPRTQQAGWGYSLTAGDLILPRSLFVDPPTNIFVQNSFEIESFGDKYVLIHLDPAKSHRLCFLENDGAKIPTAGYIGSKAEVGGTILERKVDGWYRGTTRMSN